MPTTGANGADSRWYLTRSDVARLFGVSPATVARWTREGKLPFVLTLGGQRRYVRDQIVELVRQIHESHGAADLLRRESAASHASSD